MEMEEGNDTPPIHPLKGHIVPVPTIQEINPSFEFGDAYTVEIIQRCASQVSKLLDSRFPRDPSRPLSHLRRFVKEDFLPETLRDAIARKRRQTRKSHNDVEYEDIPIPTIFVLIQQSPLLEPAQLRTLLAPFTPYYTRNNINDNKNDNSLQEESQIPIHHLTIPLQPPLTQHQADQWTRTYWPTNFNAAFPRSIIAPPAKILAATKTDIAPNAGYYLALACRVAREAKVLNRGRGVGVVVVDPALALSLASSSSVASGGGEEEEEEEEEEKEKEDGIVAVAGDARYIAPGIETRTSAEEEGNNPDVEGGPEFHAIMRVVEMVAMRRRDDTSTPSSSPPSPSTKATTTTATTTATTTENNIPPLTPLEKHYLYRSHPHPHSTTPTQNNTRILPRSAGGYLCTDLDIYITHEPCLSCSMGILLSRFRAVTFRRRGRLKTGGLASSPPLLLPLPLEQGDDSCSQKKESGEDREVYYGLHWRGELNWRAMCFEFVEDGDDDEAGVEEVGDYHA